jgi:tRNA(Ile)-lysidine synthase
LQSAVAVAVSGGRDSTALLHVTARAAALQGLQVHALHVHHGLVPEADAWLRQVQAQCRRWGRSGLPLSFHARWLSGAPAAGDSVEAWARRERYRALAAMAREAGCGLVLLAHHRRDQAETLLLQALRGGGPAGLAAMPRSAQRESITWARPWLEQPREAIEAYVRRHRLKFVDDSSNRDPRFARNRLRLAVWPALERAFPDAETQLLAAARRAQEASACLAELAAADLAEAAVEGALHFGRWRLLSLPRRVLVLRAWLRDTLKAPAPESLLQRLGDELPAARQGRWPAPGGELRLYDGLLRFGAEGVTASAAAGPEMTLDLARPGRYPLAGWGGTLVVEAVPGGGVLPLHLRAAAVRARSGGEDFQRQPGTPPRSLKKQFQQLRVPAWQRQGPLLWDGAALLFVPGLGVDARCAAPPGAPQFGVRWEPDAAG